MAPAELEDVLLYHPDVADVAVTGIPDEMMGELPVAFIVRKANSRATEKEFQKYVAGWFQHRLSVALLFVLYVCTNKRSSLYHGKDETF